MDVHTEIESKANAIVKALRILNSFTPYNHDMSTIEISRKLGFHKATTNRILRTLAQNGYLRQDHRTKRFMLGPTVFDLGRAITQSIDSNLVPIAKPFIDDLRHRLMQTITLEVLSGQTIFMAYIAEGPQLIRLAGRIGDIVPVHASAGAKAILAFSPPDTVGSLLQGKLEQVTQNTITNQEALRVHLHEIRMRGVAFDHQEISENACAIGAPIFSYSGYARAAITVSGPPSRIAFSPNSKMIAALKETAGRISSSLYHRSYPRRSAKVL